MELVTGAMSTLLPKLANLIKEEYNLQKSVRAEISFLKTELEYMEAALIKVSEAPIDQPSDPLVKLWARDVRELSYDLEDSIDAFMVHIDNDNHSPTKSKTSSFRAFMERSMNLLRKGKIRRNIGIDIEEYKKRINEVKERSDRYNKVDNIPTKPLGPNLDALQLSALFTEAKNLVGTEEKSDELVKMLMEGDDASKQHLKIISVVGFGGLGKTTLARTVYTKLKGQFACGAIVTVSHSPNPKNILKNMLQGCGFSKYDASWDEVRLVKEIREFLRDKRYFIVIDDIWETRVWEKALQYALIDNECESRVILTARSLDVGETIGVVYKLRPLSLAESRKLFNLRIFGTKENCLPNELAEVSGKILKKCDGVPLAIIMIASMLASGKEHTHEYWSNVHKIMGSGLEDSPHSINDMRRILSISYYDLPLHLKTCMLYLSSYPEDYQINVEKLIWKWVGEGFIKKVKGRSFYEVGEDYINDLMKRSMIQSSSINSHSKKPASICVHDMILDLITHLSIEDGFLTALDNQRSIYKPKMKIRRLSLRTGEEEVVKQLSTVNLDHVRSLTISLGFHNSLPAFLAPFHKKPILTHKFIRLLDLEYSKEVDNHYFKGICNLVHLRYLKLSSESITEIPEQIRKLQFLQILDVSDTGVDELPSTFNQLRQLLYLGVRGLKGIPVGFGDLKHLQELHGRITVKSTTMMHNLFELTELRPCLDLQFEEWDESYEKSFLKCLSNRCDALNPGPQQLQIIRINIARSTIFRAVPRWMCSLHAMSTLHIALLTLGAEDLHVFGSIPLLSDLKLIVEEPTPGRDEKLVITDAYPFLCLTSFEIRKNTGVAFAQGAMPKLQALELGFGVLETLANSGDFDFGLENLSSLVKVNTWIGCPEGKSDKVKDAKVEIRNALDMNPNKPRLYAYEVHRLEGHIYFEECDCKIIEENLNTIKRVPVESVDPKQGKVTVSGQVDPFTIVEKLNKAGIPVQRFYYYYYYDYYRNAVVYSPPWIRSAEMDPNSCSVM